MSATIKGYKYPVSSRTRKRTVFGRRVETINGATYTFEQREHGLYVKRKYARAWRRISFTDLLAAAEGQLLWAL